MPAHGRSFGAVLSARSLTVSRHPHRLALAGTFALLQGLGLGRFAYTSLIPPLVEAGWFSSAQAAYLGATNLLGYMLGAWGAHRLSLRFGERRALAANLALLVLSLLACALPWGFAWYGFWRLLAGVTAAVLTVVAATAVIVRVPARQRPTASAIVFAGPGLGIIASATIIPWLAERGVALAWLGIGSLALVLSWWSWRAVWRWLQPLPARDPATAAPAAIPRAAVWLVIVAYGLDAAGNVPHTLFWVDYLARELALGLRSGSNYWILFGLGAAIGPVFAGLAAAHLGFRAALVAALLAAALAVGLPLFNSSVWALVLSSLLVGALLQAVVALSAGSLAELVPAARQQQFWGRATLAFALLQAIGGYGFSAMYTAIGSYAPLFGVAAGLLLLAVLAASGALRSA